MVNIQSIQAFDKAMNSGVWGKWGNIIKGQPSELLSFETVKEVLDLKIRVNKGLQEIELSHIAGSVGRYREFSRAFSPKYKWTQDRWQRIDELFSKRGFEPITVYQVGEVYFVEDGNHRVSVSRAHGIETIEAYVIEFQTDVPVYVNDDLASILQRKNGSAVAQTLIKRQVPYNPLGDIWQWLKIRFYYRMGHL